MSILFNFRWLSVLSSPKSFTHNLQLSVPIRDVDHSKAVVSLSDENQTLGQVTSLLKMAEVKHRTAVGLWVGDVYLLRLTYFARPGHLFRVSTGRRKKE